METKTTSVLCRKANAREVASSYRKTWGVGEKWHALVARYLQLEGKLENGVVLLETCWWKRLTIRRARRYNTVVLEIIESCNSKAHHMNNPPKINSVSPLPLPSTSTHSPFLKISIRSTSQNVLPNTLISFTMPLKNTSVNAIPTKNSRVILATLVFFSSSSVVRE